MNKSSLSHRITVRIKSNFKFKFLIIKFKFFFQNGNRNVAVEDIVTRKESSCGKTSANANTKNSRACNNIKYIVTLGIFSC